jgi:hypothetical protein
MSGWQRWLGVRIVVVLVYVAGAVATVLTDLLIVRQSNPTGGRCADSCWFPEIGVILISGIAGVFLCVGLPAALIVATVRERRRVRAGRDRTTGIREVLDSAAAASSIGLATATGTLLAALAVGLLILRLRHG